MRILVTGADGLVGRAVVERGRARGMDVVGVGRAACDVTDDAARERTLDRVRPDVVLFCAAFTAVDRCAADPRAWAVNAEAPGRWAARVPTWWLSSNFVFHAPGPHGPDSTPSPRGVYAAQKVAGEAAVRAAGGHIARVGWVYGPGGKTFGSTLAARLRRGETVSAIADVVVQPTWSLDLADALLELPEGTSHHAGAGEGSWYAFALGVWARVRSGRVVPTRLQALGLPEPRPRDGRMVPARLAPFWERLDAAAAL